MTMNNNITPLEKSQRCLCPLGLSASQPDPSHPLPRKPQNMLEPGPVHTSQDFTSSPLTWPRESEESIGLHYADRQDKAWRCAPVHTRYHHSKRGKAWQSQTKCWHTPKTDLVCTEPVLLPSPQDLHQVQKCQTVKTGQAGRDSGSDH